MSKYFFKTIKIIAIPKNISVPGKSFFACRGSKFEAFKIWSVKSFKFLNFNALKFKKLKLTHKILKN